MKTVEKLTKHSLLRSFSAPTKWIMIDSLYYSPSTEKALGISMIYTTNYL
ncbi:MAG TPA: hypothetical protein VE818_00490 [Nitrososphaeraceae archaeon]|nr:hypothetical protein [Nitrososphaeraceae archaeon]